MTRSPARAATTNAVLLGQQHLARERALRVDAGERLEHAAVGAARGPDDDGWIEGGVLGHGGSWGRRGKDLDLSVRHGTHQHK